MRRTIIFLTLICQSFIASAEELFQVTLLRASPGYLAELIEQTKERKSKSDGNLIIMRHSQGDHWDLMLMSKSKTSVSKPVDYSKLVSFQHDFLVKSKSSWQEVRELSIGTGLFHIEMFHAARDKYQGLLKQRQMENNYLAATERQANLIFETVIGSDVDLFTLGFYRDLKAFAAEPDLDKSTFEKAAVAAGFKSRADIGLYLREFLVSHQDTLATQVN